MISSILKYYIFTFVILVFTACNTTVEVPSSQIVTKNLPQWFFIHNTDDNSKVYGSGAGESIDKAIDNALVDCLSNIVIGVESVVINKTKIIHSNKVTNVNKIFISQSIQTIIKTFTSQYYIEKLEKIDGQVVLLISLEKKELIDNIKLNIISEENDLQSFNLKHIGKKNILFRISTIEKALEHTKKVDTFISMLNVLGENYKTNNKTTIYTKILNSQYHDLKIYFVNTVNSSFKNDMKTKILKNLKKDINMLSLKDTTQVKLTNNNLLFTLTPCAEAYMALRANKKFWQSGRVKVYKGCNKLLVSDDKKNQIYSKRVAGIKIKDYESISQASVDSYHSQESQRNLLEINQEFRNHQQLKYLFDTEN